MRGHGIGVPSRRPPVDFPRLPPPPPLPPRYIDRARSRGRRKRGASVRGGKARPTGGSARRARPAIAMERAGAGQGPWRARRVRALDSAHQVTGSSRGAPGRGCQARSPGSVRRTALSSAAPPPETCRPAVRTPAPRPCLPVPAHNGRRGALHSAPAVIACCRREQHPGNSAVRRPIPASSIAPSISD